MNDDRWERTKRKGGEINLNKERGAAAAGGGGGGGGGNGGRQPSLGCSGRERIL